MASDTTSLSLSARAPEGSRSARRLRREGLVPGVIYGEGGGGGGSDRISGTPKTSPSGGLPLPDAEPAPVRLRGHEKLADLRPRPERRRVTEPARTPRRVPEREH